MIKLEKSDTAPVLVKPRWPYKYVHIDNVTYEALLKAQEKIVSEHIQLVLTRGLEKEGLLLKIVHSVCRKLGCAIFYVVFPTRRSEAKDIFSTNGHDKDGRSIDVSISMNGMELEFLPRGVFTTSAQLQMQHLKNQQIINSVWQALESCGFKIHSNKTESLQIHCDYQEAFFST